MLVFFFNDTATTEIYTLSLHDALPISRRLPSEETVRVERRTAAEGWARNTPSIESNSALSCSCHVAVASTKGSIDRKSTRLNSSHANISYAVFCLKKKKHPPTLSHHQY